MSVLAVGRVLSLTVQWNYTSAEIDQLIPANQTTPAQYYMAMDEQTKAWVCAAPKLVEFVRLGGIAQYIYKTLDGVPLRTIRVDNCPA
jgi:hypothetical protein